MRVQQFQNVALTNQSFIVFDKTRTTTRNFHSRPVEGHETKEIQLQLDLRNKRRSGEVDTVKNSPSNIAGPEHSPLSSKQQITFDESHNELHPSLSPAPIQTLHLGKGHINQNSGRNIAESTPNQTLSQLSKQSGIRSPVQAKMG